MNAATPRTMDEARRESWWDGYWFALRGIAANDEGVFADLAEQQSLARLDVADDAAA